jgi:dipeptidyl aminopeptidase/acylaminoacyl peptidase
MRRTHQLLIVCLLLFVRVPSAADAAEKRPMTLIDLLEIPQLADPQLSPDGKQLAFVQSRADWKANKRISHIWRIQMDGSQLTQMTNEAGGEHEPRWSSDGTHIAFLREGAAENNTGESREKTTQIFLIHNAGGEAQQLTHHATSVANLAWAPDGSAVYFLASDPKSAEEKERDKVKDDVYAFDENYQQRHLWKITLADKKEKQLSKGDFSVLSFHLSADGSTIVLVRAPTPLLGDSEQAEVYLMSAAGGKALQLTHNHVAEYRPQLSPDNQQVLFLAQASDQFESYYNGSLFIVPAAGGEARRLALDFPHAIDDAAWSRDGKAVFLLCNLGHHQELFRLELATLQTQPLTHEGHALTGWSYFPKNDCHSFLVSTPSDPGTICTLAARGQAPHAVTHLTEQVARDFQLPREEVIQWKGADGVVVEGIVTYPLNYQAGRRAPLVVQTHGGPAASDKLSFGRGWADYRPVLAAKGYAVLRPNYRGSTGYGNAFLRDMVGHYFHQAHLDVLAGVDEVFARGIADPERLVKMGWSAGGHMTNKLITFTDRFKAASSGAGAGDWVAMYAQSDVRSYRTPWFGGTPWQKDAPIGVYWDNSPLKDVWKVKTPTLFLVGEKDVRVPMPQAVEMYRALKSNGVPTRLCVAPREPHGWGELRHELYKMNVELDWFAKYALKRTYVWEKAPREQKAPERAELGGH